MYALDYRVLIVVNVVLLLLLLLFLIYQVCVKPLYCQISKLERENTELRAKNAELECAMSEMAVANESVLSKCDRALESIACVLDPKVKISRTGNTMQDTVENMTTVMGLMQQSILKFVEVVKDHEKQHEEQQRGESIQVEGLSAFANHVNQSV
ncbi:hypothetical protein DRF75_03915 [Ehrlichia minasensis]|uniref:Uncharacterized protein n=1 Tax=Ehrlichia minasensis TaxID=1242993 RepID=A0A4Q6IB00_9RICK|nr:hypothetical protein [Ehrlichia minasensis]RZB12478.1 hypothetical protein DRF75_03915 [Ehrlichia minasensis]